MENLLDRSKLLAKEVLEIEKVELGEGNIVYVRQMNGRERDLFEASLLKKKTNAKGESTYEQNTEDFRAKLAVLTLCNEKGESLLQPGDYPILSQNMSAKRLEKIITTAQKLNAITEIDKENLTKNSEADQDDNSSSGSAKN
jgi:hypothetical protein